MAKKSIKMKAKAGKGETLIKVIFKHPMETGRRKDKKTGNTVPAHYIREVKCTYKGETVLSAEWGPTIAKNPFLSFSFEGGSPGEEVTMSWNDNKGGSDSATVAIR